jgi:hypothetical protein
MSVAAVASGDRTILVLRERCRSDAAIFTAYSRQGQLMGVSDRIAEGFLRAQEDLTSVQKMFNAARAQQLGVLAPQLLRATRCDCMKVWVYLLLHIPARSDISITGLLAGVGDALGSIDSGHEKARAEAAAATHLVMHRSKPDKDLNAKRVQQWADAMLVMTYGDCRDVECPVADAPRGVFTDSVLQVLSGASRPQSRQGAYNFNGRSCYVVEVVLPFGAKGASFGVGGGATATIVEQLKVALRYIFCFYTYPPPPTPPSPGDPGRPPGGGPSTGGPPWPAPTGDPPPGPTTETGDDAPQPVGPTPATGRGRRRRAPPPRDVGALTSLVFAGTFRSGTGGVPLWPEGLLDPDRGVIEAARSALARNGGFGDETPS